MPKDCPSSNGLCVSIGQYSTAGVKSENQDFHGAVIPKGKALTLKGVALAVADGISSSHSSREAAELAVQSILEDYYHTSDAWTVQAATERVISATNAWLYSLNQRAMLDTPDHGKICTLSALVLKGGFAHISHVGDSRIWRLSGDALEPLTRDHSAQSATGETVLSGAIGLYDTPDLDYQKRPVSPGEIFLLTTDGLHRFWDIQKTVHTIKTAKDLQTAAEQIASDALAAGSDDNLTIQIIRVDKIPAELGPAALGLNADLPILKHQSEGATVDGFRIIRLIHSNNRSHIYLAVSPTGEKVALKFPATETHQDPIYMRRFLMEEWIARRLQSPHVIKAAETPESRTSLYVVTEFIQGQTLRQWMADHPNPSMETIRDIASQMIKGLRAFHRKDMLHKDFRPENIMIDADGTVKIIDLGSTRIAGVQEALPEEDTHMLGTLQYSAPEYIVGDRASVAADQFSLGVVIYEMLTGRLPFRSDAARVETRRDVARLVYRDAQDGSNAVPYWINHALKRATHPDPNQRFAALSEFEAALRAPLANVDAQGMTPLLQRDPLRFWQGLCAVLVLIILALLAR